MARGNYDQTSFAEGEWSPFMQGKTDEPGYYRALRVALNYIVLDEENAVRRSGTRLSAHAKDNTGSIRLIEFISESNDALICELTDQLTRFHSRGSLLTEGEVSVASISTATPAVVTTTAAHGWSTGNTVLFTVEGSSFASPVRNWQFVITVTGATTFTLANHSGPLSGSVNGAVLNAIASAYLLNVSRVVEKSLPYTAAQLNAVKYSEEENTLFLFHPSHEIQTIERAGPAVVQLDLEDGPYFDQNETATTLGFSATTGSGVTVTASSATGINDGQGFLTTDVGRLIRVNTGTAAAPSWSWIEITAHTSTVIVTGTIRGPDLEATTAVTTWRLGLYSDTTGWPTHGVVHENRLFLISNVRPGRLDGSVSNDFDNFTPTDQEGTVADSNAVSAIFNGAGRQNARWLQVIERGLLVGADGGEFVVRASTLDDPITPFSIQVRRHTQFGAADNVQPVLAGRNSVFVQELGRGLIEYKNAGGVWDGNDVARKARHLTTNGITDIAYAREPVPILWALRGDGRLLSCTYRDDAKGEQAAWCRHSVQWAADVAAGEDADERYLREGASQSTASVYSIAAAPFSDIEVTRNDSVWLAVLREDTVCVEYITPVFDASFFANEGFFVDSGNTYYTDDEGVSWEVDSNDGTDAVITYYGLDRLEGKSVEAVIRGYDAGADTVASGEVTFTVPADLLTAGAALEAAVGLEYAAGGFTENNSFGSENRQTSTNTFGAPPAGNGLFTGEDGVQYYIAGGINGIGGSSDTVLIYNAAGSLAFSLDNATVQAAADAAGIIPPGGHVTSTSNHMAFNIPETPYIFILVRAAFGVSYENNFIYYKINSGGSLELVGGYASKTDSNQGGNYGTIAAVGDQACAVGFVNFAPYRYTSSARVGVSYEYPIAVAFGGDGGSQMITAPSINQIVEETPILINDTDPFEEINRLFSATDLGSNALQLTDGPSTDVNATAFFLPLGLSGAKLYIMWQLGDIEAHNAGTEGTTNPLLDTNASSYLTGLLSSMIVNLFGDLDVEFGFNTLLGAVTVSENDNVYEDDGVTSAFPFDDAKQDFAGNTTTATDDFYLNPSCYPSDVTNISAPWFVFWPKVSRTSGHRDTIGIRVFQYNPYSGVFRQMDYLETELYTIGTDVNSDTRPIQANVAWDRSTGDVDVLIRTEFTGSRAFIVSQAGTFSPVAETGAPADHVEAVIGCTYESRGQLLRPAAGVGAQHGGALAKLRRVDQYGLLLYRAGPMDIGTNFDTMYAVDFRTDLNPADVYGRAPLFTGVAHGTIEGTHDFDNLIAWKQDRPLPGAIQAIGGFSNASDR